MKQPIFTNTKTMFRRTQRLIKTGIVRTGQRALNRISADLGKKEYPVFVEPVVRRLRHRFPERFPGWFPGWFPGRFPERFKERFKRASTPFSKADVVAEAMATPGDLSGAEDSLAESSLIEEVFVRPVPAVYGPDEERVAEQPESSESVQGPTSETGPGEEVTGTLPEGQLDTEPETVLPGEHTRARSSNGPLVHTMVEAVPDSPASDGGLSDFLVEDLQELFKATNYTNPRTKALLKGREYVDVHELAKELDEYARSIGAVP